MATTSSADYDQVRKDYDTQASQYNDLFNSPFGILETQLVAAAVATDGTCLGAFVLDLGGGTGVRARQVLDLGAAKVDVVDLSASMLEVGKKDAEDILGEHAASSKLGWFLKDVTAPLFGPLGMEGLQNAGSYDLVMANWVFDHVGDLATLEAIWANISAALRPGGWFVGVRACDPRTPAMTTGTYGPICHDFKEFPGGLQYRSIIPSEPPVYLENTSLEISYTGSTELHEKYGFCGVKVIDPKHTETVKADLPFWQLWIDKPGFQVVKARKV